MQAIVAERGQVTIPKSLRDKLGITHHTHLDFTAENGRLVAVKVTDQDPVAKVFGCARCGKSTDDIIKELRGDSL